jgi:two-component system chemotaxis response regulator CheB
VPVRRDVAVIGASAGGIEALVELFRLLPATIPATLAVVVHRAPFRESHLAAVLGRRTALPVLEPADRTTAQPGRIYLAPRDHHLLVDGAGFRLSRGPKQHATRPAIDPLFRSAAETYGPRVVGVVLSGAGDDGVRGLIGIKAAGGASLVQSPAEARVPILPRAAIAEDDVDRVLTLDGIAAALVRLAAHGVAEEPLSKDARHGP